MAHQISLAVSYGLSCCSACGISLSSPGTELASLAVEGEFLTTGPLGKSLWKDLGVYIMNHFVILPCNKHHSKNDKSDVQSEWMKEKWNTEREGEGKKGIRMH